MITQNSFPCNPSYRYLQNRDRLLPFPCMDLFSLTRRLIDIESVTPNEVAVGDFLCDELRRRGFEARKMPVENERANVLATWPGHTRPEVVFSTHMDTVPLLSTRPKTATASTAAAPATPRDYRRSDSGGGEAAPVKPFVGLLFLVGEERDSIGAKAANQQPIGARFMINGEPTENKLALASKGAARGTGGACKMAHSHTPNWASLPSTNWWKRCTGCTR